MWYLKDSIKVALGILIALLLHTALGKISLPLVQLFNFFSLVVIYFALAKGETFGACLGAACGLIQDTFSLGVFGVAGIAKTMTGFLAGYISKKVNVVPSIRIFLFIFFLISLEFIIWTLLSAFVFFEGFHISLDMSFFQPISTALVGSLLYPVLRKIDQKRQNS